MENTLQLTEITSKDKLERITRSYIDDIVEGEVNPLQAVTVVAALEQFVKSVRGHVLVKDAVRAELEKYGSKTVKFNGATFTMKTVGTRYDFSVCDDPVWRELKARSDNAAAALKEREEMLKVLPLEGITVVDDATGEVCHVCRPGKTSEEGYSITLDK
jgi:hypothetical protein